MQPSVGAKCIQFVVLLILMPKLVNFAAFLWQDKSLTTLSLLALRPSKICGDSLKVQYFQPVVSHWKIKQMVFLGASRMSSLLLSAAWPLNLVVITDLLSTYK